MDHHQDRELPGIARYLSDLSDDSGQASLPHSSDSESDFVEPEKAGPPKIDRRAALFFCELCEIECSSVEVLQDHFAGIKHQKKLGLKGLSSNLKTKYDIKYEDELSGKVVECTLCKVIFHGLEQAFHFKSERHRALCNFATESKIDNRQWLRVICDAPERSAEDEMMNMDKAEKVTDGYHCNLCSATMPTMTLFQAHIEGKRHQKKARWQYLCVEGDMSEVNQYWCRLCNMFCTDRDALTAHYRGRNHIKLLQKKNIIQADDADKSSDTSRKKGSSSSRSKSIIDEMVDVKLHSRYSSKQYHYRSESSERSYSPPLCSPIRSPSPPQPPLKQRNRSPWSYNRRFSHRSPSPSESSSYYSPERGGHSSKQSFHHHSNRRRSRSSRSRSREGHRRDSFKSQGRRDSNFQTGRNSSGSHSQRRRYVSDSDSTQESYSSSLSRGRSMHRSRGRHHHVYSSSDSQSYSRSRSRHRHHSFSRSRSRSRDNRHRDKSSRSRGRSRGRVRGGHHDAYGSTHRWGDGKHHMERRLSRPQESQSEEENELGRFEGFSRNWSSDESSGDTPPIASLSVSHILHAIRKECRKY